MHVPNFLQQRLAAVDGTSPWPRIIEATLIVLLAIQAARLLWLLLPAAPLGAANGGDSGPVAPALPMADLFFRATSVATNGPSADAAGFTLRGIRIGSDGGSVILADGSGRQQSYTLGESPAPGLRVQQIGRGFAILQDGSGARRLELLAPVSGAAPRIEAPSRAAAAPTAGAAAPTAADLLASAGLSPAEGGGFTVNPRGDANPLRAAGLQAGDRIVAIDGQDLTAERVAALRDELAPGAPVTLTVVRDGQSRTVTLTAPP